MANALTDLKSADIETIYLTLYEHMFTARVIDRIEDAYVGRGEAFFHVAGGGHEATAALAPHLISGDYLHCHYRDKALMLARGLDPAMFFHSVFCKDASHSRGRQMSAHLSDPDLHILSLVGPVGNNALQAAGVAAAIKQRPDNPIVLCAMGDGTSQEGESLEAVAEAVRDELPVLFLIEDNKFSISTLTQDKTFYAYPDGRPDSFYGIPIQRIDGRNTTEAYETFGRVVDTMRSERKPAIVLFEVDRLSNHTNADDQRVYRSQEDIEAARAQSDPLERLEAYLLDNNLTTADALESKKAEIRTAMQKTAVESRKSAEPQPVFDAVKPLPAHLRPGASEYRGDDDQKELTMLEAIRRVLDKHLAEDERVSLYGEDIADPKGDVFGLTKGLSTKYPGRVRNSPLAEATIVGVSVGRALAGERPVAFLQFADFLPIAFNQIVSELGSMFWRTDGGWQAPVIIMITCGGYRPGLGPFHAQTFEALAAHTPGLDVFMPSTAGDAAGMLNAAFASERPTLFFYPKSCLNERANATSTDIHKHLVPVGKGRVVRSGDAISLVTYGNGVSRCLQAAQALAEAGAQAEVIDLRSVMPWDKELVIRSAEKTGHLLAVHEDNHTCGMGAEIIATVAEQAKRPVRFARVTRPDTYVPCNFENQLEVLPSYKKILETAGDLLGLDVQWQKPAEAEAGFSFVEAIGTSPADEAIKMTSWNVKVGDVIAEGDLIGEFEADKAVSELLSPAGGEIVEILAAIDEQVKIGTPILKLKVGEGDEVLKKPITQENPGTPIIRMRAEQPANQDQALVANGTGRTSKEVRPRTVGLSLPTTELGSRLVSNEDLVGGIEGKTAADVSESTGINNRIRIGDGQDVLSMAVGAAKAQLAREQLSINDISLVLATTGTPGMMTPSLACRVLNELAEAEGIRANIPAYDINAACSGYVYALNSGWDALQSNPEGRVLVVTSEVLSPLLDTRDFLTATIFADGASASILSGEAHLTQAAGPDGGPVALVKKPYLTADGEKGDILSVPMSTADGQAIHMDGMKTYTRAVRKMIQALKKACLKHNVAVDDLDLIVPHQANQNIIDSVRFAVQFPEEKVFSHIADKGNTSSSTIPIALSEALPTLKAGSKVGLVAFGGGFTFGATILEMR